MQARNRGIFERGSRSHRGNGLRLSQAACYEAAMPDLTPHSSEGSAASCSWSRSNDNHIATFCHSSQGNRASVPTFPHIDVVPSREKWVKILVIRAFDPRGPDARDNTKLSRLTARRRI